MGSHSCTEKDASTAQQMQITHLKKMSCSQINSFSLFAFHFSQRQSNATWAHKPEPAKDSLNVTERPSRAEQQMLGKSFPFWAGEDVSCWVTSLIFFQARLEITFNLKCPYYAFSNITFHAVCHVAVCEIKLSTKLWSRQCMINKVIIYIYI